MADMNELRWIVNGFLEWHEGGPCPEGLIERARAAVPNASDWQPIETAPEDEHLLLAIKKGHYFIGWWVDEGDGVRWHFRGDVSHNLKPVAWMPLPAHPEDQRVKWPDDFALPG